MRSGFVFWGVALVAAGAVALGVEQGYLNREAVPELWRFWPLILVAIGISIVLARTQLAILGTVLAGLLLGAAGGLAIVSGVPPVGCAGDEPVTLTTQQGTLGAQANVSVGFDCGSLELAIRPDGGWTVASGRTGGSPARVDATTDSLEIRRGSAGSWWQQGRQRWIVDLPQATRYEELAVETNAGSSVLDLGEGTIGLLQIETNAGSSRLVLADASVLEIALGVNAGSAAILVSERTSLMGELEVNAGSITLCTTPETALRITIGSTNAFGHDVDESGMQLVGETTWQTSGWEAAERRVTLTVNGNAGSFSLNPEEGCE